MPPKASSPNPFLPGAPKMFPDHSASLSWTALSESGSKKPVNDDSWLAFASDPNGANLLPMSGSHSLANHDVILAVSDGMGGGNAGDIASELLLRELSKIIPNTFKKAAEGLYPDYISHLEKAIHSVHLAINEESVNDPAKEGMAATLALAWFTPDNLYIANVGDSRIYIHRNQKTEQLTLDHTLAWAKMNRGEISERQFRAHPRRAALYEVVGGGHRNVNPHIAAIPYQPGDLFLICSDGLIDGVWNKHIHSAFIKNVSSTSETATALISRAVENDGSDDTTLIVISVAEDTQQ